MEIVVDSNIIVSAILFPTSIVAKVFAFVLENHTLVLCDYIVSEIENVFLKKFPHKINEMEKFIGKIKYRKFDLDEMDISKYPPIRDIDDFPILVAAIESNADMLITGDKDFDEIKINKPIIVKPRDFADKFMN
jgi:putative PIN family toxin of toxin-antitoxin system